MAAPLLLFLFTYTLSHPLTPLAFQKPFPNQGLHWSITEPKQKQVCSCVTLISIAGSRLIQTMSPSASLAWFAALTLQPAQGKTICSECMYGGTPDSPHRLAYMGGETEKKSARVGWETSEIESGVALAMSLSIQTENIHYTEHKVQQASYLVPN
ncbi:hypothetical protein BO79DRAFT_214948 [Aspergillus costaricaensis CBS 115574]|uniref:Uncharacterized protein n=1 Tax=Aspergillus costaricaensis CBS 115574 TaxID=1448317 RepID=A0ACD1IQH1_9EURO|nr:hypothetical protein BO79DRAFT_214948 [Aspergillus costaricaensis CBS 115574]RAK92001.1 hypothetical protein BO79DRAFT_214948 [Aspergillus costaricaensis CBS 115574]